MGTPEADRRALTASERIERLELAVSQLSAALGLLVAQLQDQGCAFPGEIGKALTLGAADDHGARPRASRARRSGSSRKKIDAAPSGLAGATLRGEAVKWQWVASGELVPARLLAESWGLTPQALGPAARRGEVFALVIKRQRFYPCEFLYLDRGVVAAISKALGHLSASQKLVFFKRPHGALGGRTLLQTLTSADEVSGLASVARLATAWADEAPAGAESVEAA
ncbi:MAG: hypothetical protein KGO02_24785 [Alphaproteobacteria bacterium]|nr:hypothetical protein [Alphaproteobacteria bacterium]